MELETHNHAETILAGQTIALKIESGAIFCFFGDLGSGKTTLIKGICRGLHVTDWVTSPTFTLINEYQGRLPVFHFDFCRMNSLMDLADLGVEEYFERDGVCLIEWPEIIENLLPKNFIRFSLNMTFQSGYDNFRTITIKRPDF
ncbi:tRNA (adenosine(37)-N6)-threonylcarbamoyltransferase complex ATPase subunit type 1 TsaE [candidate division KSB1 bacterium]|nr:tRNA (adenosine(37)-N6)-threonylcarbamoyltransferase complex ATPase subunit type 1 TsaE [candidate division KSB1 bacterium]